jgi:hypothetical protein
VQVNADGMATRFDGYAMSKPFLHVEEASVRARGGASPVADIEIYVLYINQVEVAFSAASLFTDPLDQPIAIPALCVPYGSKCDGALPAGLEISFSGHWEAKL